VTSIDYFRGSSARLGRRNGGILRRAARLVDPGSFGFLLFFFRASPLSRRYRVFSWMLTSFHGRFPLAEVFPMGGLRSAWNAWAPTTRPFGRTPFSAPAPPNHDSASLSLPLSGGSEHDREFFRDEAYRLPTSTFAGGQVSPCLSGRETVGDEHSTMVDLPLELSFSCESGTSSQEARSFFSPEVSPLFGPRRQVHVPLREDCIDCAGRPFGQRVQRT